MVLGCGRNLVSVLFVLCFTLLLFLHYPLSCVVGSLHRSLLTFRFLNSTFGLLVVC